MSDTLVLNKNYHAIHIIPWQKSVSLVYQGAAQAVDEGMVAYGFEDWVELTKQMKSNSKGFVNSATMRIAVPEVIRLTRYDKLPRQDVTFTRHNIYDHYKYKCCYCGDRMPTAELNLDHVMPRKLGGETNWFNIVLSCLPCNAIKDDKTLGSFNYPSVSRLKEMGYDRLLRLAGQPMRLLVKPSKPRWQGVRSIVVKSPIPLPVSWQRLIDTKYWESELER